MIRRSALLVLLAACDSPTDTGDGHGPIAEGIMAPLGQPRPDATETQLATFARGKVIAERRLDTSDGLGPGFNVVLCASCHEKPTTGGSAGLYRNFFLAGQVLEDGSFFFGSSAGNNSGVVRMNYEGTAYDARPAVPEADNVFAQRNGIPVYGMGLIAALDDDEILSREDEDDADGDGVSGRANFDRGFVGRFGMKAQTASIEAFIRGPLMNHAGLTSDPLSEAQRAELPVDSSVGGAAWFDGVVPEWLQPEDPFRGLGHLAQAAAPDAPLTDNDAVADPELAGEDLFDLVSFAMLLAAPDVEEPAGAAERGRQAFDDAGCDGCHTPRLEGPTGPIPTYSDLLLHDMGPDLADGIVMGYATASEFRTMPLWGVGPAGPYLHDGRAHTLDEAIRMHGGEADRSRERYEGLEATEREELVEFLLSLGGRAQVSTGMLVPDAPVPEVGEWGGPIAALSDADQVTFAAARERFDHEFGFSDGVGNPRFNGDSCRACHFDPVIGGAGPRDLNVMRHGILTEGSFLVPTIGTVLHRETALRGSGIDPQDEVNVFESRNSPPLFGLGLLEAVPDATIEALADPDDARVPDGISGRVARVDGGRLGRFGWKADVPTIDEFVRDAVANELGMTLPLQDGLTFGRIHDNDAVADPELTEADAALIAHFIRSLGPPPRPDDVDPDAEARGEARFEQVGCDGCHVPVLDGTLGPVAAYTDLLLHDILPAGTVGIEGGSATMTELRTPPLWGLSETGPYLHDGTAETLAEAITAHDGEGAAARDAFAALSEAERADLLLFLESR